jgi:tetratricopeptide (TPR) repeat protein
VTPDAEQSGKKAVENAGGLNHDLAKACETALKLAFEMRNAGRDEQASALCQVLLPLCPRDAQLFFLAGMIAHKAGRHAEAIERLARAAELEPNSTRILDGLGCAYQRLNGHVQAARVFARSLKLDPRSAATCYNYGNTCYQLGELEPAVALFRRAAELDPRDHASWNNLGKCLKELNRLDEAIAAYDRALEVAPEYQLARYGRAISLLSAGRLTAGFREYECRWQTIPRRQFPQPAWRGESAPGKTLFLHPEQGFGDAIQAVRFIPAARERVGRVILECRPELKTLFQYSKCADTVIAYGEPLPPFDCIIPLISLPLALGITPDSIPNRTPYLSAPAGQDPPVPMGNKLKVGLVWAGNAGHHHDAMRSIPLEELAPVLNVPDVAFFSLQLPVPQRDEAYLGSISDRLHAGPPLTDFLATAMAINALDLVIAVDTAVAHLAGALGKPVWTLIQYSPDWRWFLERTDTPWYPTMRLFRQTERNRWETPVLQVAEALRQLASTAGM